MGTTLSVHLGLRPLHLDLEERRKIRLGGIVDNQEEKKKRCAMRLDVEIYKSEREVSEQCLKSLRKGGTAVGYLLWNVLAHH
jgi:hypothetical protein